MVLVKPEPGRHPVSTMTTSPFLKKPRALPGGREEGLVSEESSEEGMHLGDCPTVGRS